MNTLATASMSDPYGKVSECIQFNINDISDQFVLNDIMTIGRRYTLSLWLASDQPASISVAGDTFASTSAWSKYSVTFTAGTTALLLEFGNAGVYYIYHPQLEIGTLATDWTPAPEDADEAIDSAQSTANSANESATSANNRVSTAEATLQVLSNCISTLVTDENGGSLMTQTPDGGWTFSMAETNAAVSDLQGLLDTLQRETGSTKATVDALNQVVGDHGATLEYVNITTYEDEPCIELGESDSEFKLLITNTRIMFMSGTNVPTYINTNGLVTQNIEVQGEIIQGGYVQLNTSDGGWGLLWKGVSS